MSFAYGNFIFFKHIHIYSCQELFPVRSHCFTPPCFASKLCSQTGSLPLSGCLRWCILSLCFCDNQGGCNFYQNMCPENFRSLLTELLVPRRSTAPLIIASHSQQISHRFPDIFRHSLQTNNTIRILFLTENSVGG